MTTVTEVGMDGDISPYGGRRGETRVTFSSPPRYSEDHTPEGKIKPLLSESIPSKLFHLPRAELGYA
jgi:hypothetical protein